MSSTSTIRRFGTAKTYGRVRENTSSRAFDEMVTGKPTPIKAAPSYTKWGKTNFVAIREDQKNKPDAAPESERKVELKVDEDPFSFDTEDKRKSSPGKSQRVVSPEVSRPATKLPASRIVTQGNLSHASPDGPKTAREKAVIEGNQTPQGAIARPGRTYTHSQEGRTSTGPSGSRPQLIMDQFVEVGKTVKTNAGVEVIYITQPHSPRPAKPPVSSTSSPEDLEPPRSSSSLDECDDEDDIFPATFRREPLKTYSGEIITPIIDVPDSPPPSKKRRTRTRGRRQSRYTDPSLIEEYRRRYEASSAHLRDHTSGMNNSTVVCSKEVRNTQGTTLVVVCKPKVDVAEKKDDVQSKYFKNVKKELDKADKNSVLEFSESDTQDEEAKSDNAEEEETVIDKIPSSKALLPSSQETVSSVVTPTRTLRVRFADDVVDTPRSSTSNTCPAKKLKSTPSKAKAKTSNSSKELSLPSSSESGSTELDTNTGGRRTRSGGRQYRIFKSRGPKAPQTTASENENSETAGSPQMPELTPEIFTPSCIETNSSDGKIVQNPPNITDEEDDEYAKMEETHDSLENCSLQTEELSQEISIDLSQESCNELSQKTLFERQGTLSPTVTQETIIENKDSSTPIVSQKVVFHREESPSSPVKDSDSLEVPSPAEMSDDSQELVQEGSLVEGTSKIIHGTASAPRRFFKSKKLSNASSLQRKVLGKALEKSPSKATYNARSWNQDQDQSEKEPNESEKRGSHSKNTADSEFGTDTGQLQTHMPRLKRHVHWPDNQDKEVFTSLKVTRQHKELYTVVHNVKQAHEVQEWGETQDFMDDVDYLLESLRDSEPTPIRTLSTIQLAGKCIMPAFRMHLRAHGTVTKIFSLLHDACSDPSLALSTAAMMFMLSRDRLNMDLDKDSLHLMLKLNEVDMPRSSSNQDGEAEFRVETHTASTGNEDSTEVEKCRVRVQELLVQLQRETNAKQIDLDFVSTGNLAMESLLSLTSRRAGEWFKEELRILGGLDHFVETIHHCGSELKEDLPCNLEKYMPSLRKLDRCLRVLENITFTNTDNQMYLIAYNKGLLISSTCRILQLCQHCLPSCALKEEMDERQLKDQPGWTLFTCMLAILRVLLNITHDNEFGSTKVGEEAGLLNSILVCVLSTQWFVPSDYRFDILVLSLGLLVNLMEHCAVNRHRLAEAQVEGRMHEDILPSQVDAVQALVQLFLQREAAARQMEEALDTPSMENDSPNKSGEWCESDSGIQWITKSAEKVKAAEAAEKANKTIQSPNKGVHEGIEGKGATERPIDGASILEDEETFTKALHKAGKHMENSIVASYVGLLLGCLIQDNRKYVDAVKEHLPDGSFESMIKILKKFLGFMNLTTAVGTTDSNSIQRVIDALEAC